jgi:hypothetical protein
MTELRELEWVEPGGPGHHQRDRQGALIGGGPKGSRLAVARTYGSDGLRRFLVKARPDS